VTHIHHSKYGATTLGSFIANQGSDTEARSSRCASCNAQIAIPAGVAAELFGRDASKHWDDMICLL
jgi:hypothetical protein